MHTGERFGHGSERGSSQPQVDLLTHIEWMRAGRGIGLNLSSVNSDVRKVPIDC